jgi:pyrroline-5-carboxylate reductase
MPSKLAFIGGGNMASAIMGGLLRQGLRATFIVIEPFEAQRQKLQQDFGIAALPQADHTLAQASLVVWAVKPQSFKEAAAPCAAHTGCWLPLSR